MVEKRLLDQIHGMETILIARPGINTLGPEGGAAAEDRIKRNQELFKMIGGTFGITGR